MRILSWNLHQSTAAWDSLSSMMVTQGVDVALVQEAVLPGAAPDGLKAWPPFDEPSAWWIPVPAAVMRPWCSAVVARKDAVRRFPRPAVPLGAASSAALSATHPGQFAVADVAAGSEVLTVVSLYGLWERMPDGGDIYAEATLHRVISDVTPVLQARDRHPIVLAGDLNLWHDYPERVWGERYRTVFGRLAAYDLEVVGPFREPAVPAPGNCVCGRPRDVGTSRPIGTRVSPAARRSSLTSCLLRRMCER